MSVTPMTTSEMRKIGTAEFYDFDPEIEYVIRSPDRGYQGSTEKFRFANGQAVAPMLVPNATDEQKWNRAERLARVRNAGYVIYMRGTEWQPKDEPLWASQSPPDGDSDGENTGEAGPGWRPHETVANEKSTNRGLDPEPEGDTGESTPSVPVTRAS